MKTINIEGVEYQFQGDALKRAIEEAIIVHKNNPNRKGAFWDDLYAKTGGVSKTTVKGWYFKYCPRHPEDLLAVLTYLNCDNATILIPIGKDVENKTEDVLDVKHIMKKLGVSISFMNYYLQIGKGYSITNLFLWRVLNGKIIPSSSLRDDILELLALVEKNTRYSKCNPMYTQEDDDIHFINACVATMKIKMQQLGVDMLFLQKYLTKIKNFEVSMLQLIALINGYKKPSESFCRAMEELFLVIQKYIAYTYFPLYDNQRLYYETDKRLNNELVYRRVIPLVFTKGRNSIIGRANQIRRMRNYAIGKDMKLNESYMHVTYDSSVYNIRTAMEMVEAGYYDAVLVYDRELIGCDILDKQIIAYAVCHNIPIIFLSEVFYG